MSQRPMLEVVDPGDWLLVIESYACDRELNLQGVFPCNSSIRSRK
jgi:hypothetical protein